MLSILVPAILVPTLTAVVLLARHASKSAEAQERSLKATSSLRTDLTADLKAEAERTHQELLARASVELDGFARMLEMQLSLEAAGLELLTSQLVWLLVNDDEEPDERLVTLVRNAFRRALRSHNLAAVLLTDNLGRTILEVRAAGEGTARRRGVDVAQTDWLRSLRSQLVGTRSRVATLAIEDDALGRSPLPRSQSRPPLGVTGVAIRANVDGTRNPTGPRSLGWLVGITHLRELESTLVQMGKRDLLVGVLDGESRPQAIPGSTLAALSPEATRRDVKLGPDHKPVLSLFARPNDTVLTAQRVAQEERSARNLAALEPIQDTLLEESSRSRSAMLSLALLSTAVLLAALIIASRVIGRIATRIKKLELATHALIRGGKVDLSGLAAERDETGILASRFIEMSEAIAQRDQRLREHASSLEELVRSRTSQLERQNAHLRHARDGAAEAARAKSEFLSTMSHEIRTPINGLLGIADILIGELQEERALELVREQVACGRDLLTIVNDVLDLARADSGRLAFEVDSFDPKQLLQASVAATIRTGEEKGLDMHASIDEDLPPALRGDVSRLRQVLVNFIGNAIKFTSAGQVRVRVTQRSEAQLEDGCMLRCSVRDEGIGIPRETQRRVFDAFAQAEASTARRYGGTGLGLAICKGIIEAMGGRVGVKSEPNKGSCFYFEVPVGFDTTALASPTEPSVLAAKPAKTVERVLVVDDNPVNLRVAKTLIERLGPQVELVPGGAEAVEAVRGGAFDLVLMDLRMPDMDGFEATRRIRELPGPAAGVRIVALSADVLDDVTERCLIAGMQGFVAKPFKREDLAEVLTAATPQGSVG